MSFGSRHASLLAILALSVGCPEGDLEEIAPKIQVDLCATPANTEDDPDWLGGYDDCALDFGPRDISVRTTLELRVSNDTQVILSGPDAGDADEMDIFLTTDSDPSFRIELAPRFIESGITQSIVVSYRPNTESEHRATLVIKSDAVNVPEGQDVIIPITGSGVDNGIPNVEIATQLRGDDGPTETPRCDFKRVAASYLAVCDVEIENTGARALVFDGVNLLGEHDGETLPVVPAGSSLAPFGFIGREPQADDVVAAPPEVNKVAFAVQFTPDTLGVYKGMLQILTNDPDRPEILVELTGEGVDPPTCAVGVKSVNGIPVGSGAATIEPLDDVVLTAEASTPSDLAGSIASVQWEFLEQPPGSTASFSDPDGIETGFRFADVVGVDLAGRYRVKATVIDDLGTSSVNECIVEFQAIPSDSFLVQLTWDTAGGDMDLHIAKQTPGGQFCPQGVNVGPVSDDCGSSDDDCYYANCTPDDTGRPDWDSESGFSVGDPSLDIDDLSGFGPENTNIDAAVSGQYLVGVDYFSGTGVTGNTIRIYVYGQLAAEFYQELNNSDFWEVAVIHWPEPGEGVPCIEDLSTSDEECP